MAFNSYRSFGLPGSMQYTTDQDPIARLKQQIGFSDEPVQDHEGYWTIGYGRRLNDSPGGPAPYATISEPIADEELRYFVGQGGDASGRLPPAEQQVADVYVNRFPNDAHGFGHLGIAIDTDKTRGFYPAQSQMAPEGLGLDVLGTVRNDDLMHPHDTLRIPTTPDQDAAVQKYINQRASTPGDYNLYGRNCSEFVDDALEAGKIDTPALSVWPNFFFDRLQRRYGSKE